METVHRPLQEADRREHHVELIVHCLGTSQRAAEINARPLVLGGNGEIYIDSNNHGSHRVSPYFIPDPEKPYEGLATTTTVDATPIQDWLPTLNWIYIDAHTHQLKYGVREDADCNFAGPFDCAAQDQHLTFETWEGFCAVEVHPNVWAVYFDVSDNGLRGRVPPGARILEIELERREAENNVAAASNQIAVTEIEVEEDTFQRNSTSSPCSEVDQDLTVHTATSVICTRLKSKKRHVKEELILTIPLSSIDGDSLPVEARLLETVYEDDIEETYSLEQICSNQLHGIADFDLATIPEEDFIETPAPDPHVIDKLEADVIAMLGIASGDSDDFETFDSDASTRSTSGTSLPTDASSPRDIASKPLPPLPIESLSIDNEATNELPTTGARRQDIDHRPDSTGALVQSPTMLPGSPGRMWDASRNPKTTVQHRPSRITLDPDQLSAIEDLSHSLEFGERPLSLSLCAYTNIWSKPQKESPVKKFLNKVTEGNKKMYKGVKYAGPRSFRTRRRRSGISYIGKAEAERPDTRRCSA